MVTWHIEHRKVRVVREHHPATLLGDVGSGSIGLLIRHPELDVELHEGLAESLLQQRRRHAVGRVIDAGSVEGRVVIVHARRLAAELSLEFLRASDAIDDHTGLDLEPLELAEEFLDAGAEGGVLAARHRALRAAVKDVVGEGQPIDREAFERRRLRRVDGLL